MRTAIFCILLIISNLCFSAKPPVLTPSETIRKSNEILKAHVKYKQFDEVVAKKTFTKFVEELDPAKTYFVNNEVVTWTSPSEDTIQDAIRDFQNSRFTQFERIYSAYLTAIERRNAIEKALLLRKNPLSSLQVKKVKPLLVSQDALVEKQKNTVLVLESFPFASEEEHVDSHEFKNIKWAKSEDELTSRIKKIQKLQLDAAEKFAEESKGRFMKRLEKRRLSRESEFVGLTASEQHRQVQTFFLKALAGALDAHTAYFTPTEADQFLLLVQQRLVGIGAQLRDDLNGFTLTRLLEGGPALKGGVLKTGDRIIAVDNEPVVGLDITEAVELIKGEKGTKVTLTICREEGKAEKTFSVDVIREEIILQESRFESDATPFGDGNILHLKLYSFYKDEKNSSAEDIRKAFVSYAEKAPIYGVILDLRNNAGGLLDQAVAVSSLFINRGIVCSVKDYDGHIQHLRNLNDNRVWNGPLIVLTNVGSASASEIVAQTLQDYGRAFIVGDERTYGKGSYQTFTLGSLNNHKINPKGEYKVTRGLYYTVSGKSPQFVGAKANIVVPGVYSELEVGEKFAPYALPNESIEAGFHDSMQDVHPFYRGKISNLYAKGSQDRISTFYPYLDQLSKNSQDRIAANKNYQNLLTALHSKNYDFDKVDDFGKQDLQLNETIEIMKDFISLQSE